MDRSLEEIFNIRKEVKVLILMFIGILFTGALGFSLIKEVNLYGGLIFTLETLSFLHQEDSGPARTLQIFLIFFGVFLVWFIMWTTLDLALEGNFKKYFLGVRKMDKIKKLKNHYIICGSGRVGENIARILKQNKKDFVLIEKSIDIANELEEKGYLIVHGTSVEEETLLKAGVKKAKFLIACTGDDSRNVLITLNAKELNPDIVIIARANDEVMVKKLKRAGARHVFLPELIGAKEAVNELEIYK